MTKNIKTGGQGDNLADLAKEADTFDDAERRKLLKRIGRVGLAAVPTAIILSNATEAQAATGGDGASSGGGGFDF